MNKEEKFLLSVCKSYIDNSTPVLDDINFKSFFSLAKSHNLIGVCHCVFSKNKELSIPSEIRQLFMDKFFDLVYIYELQAKAIKELEHNFAKNEVPFILFKGAKIKELYPVPESRTMGDIDVLTNDENQERAHGVMLALGFECYSSSGTVREYTRDDVKVEVHSRLTSEFGKNAFADAFDNATFDGFDGTLDDSYHFAYLIAHLANHLKCAGAGIRLVLDLAIMQNKCKIDFDKVFNVLKDINLESFGKVILSVCYNWFGCGKCFVKNTDKVEEYMLKYGVFGGSRNEKEFTVSRLFQCEAFENGNKKSNFALKLSLAFPPYKTLRKAPYLNFLDGRPYLLPVAWIYRFFYNLKNRRKHMLSTIKNIDDEKTTALAKEELEFFEEIGLWHS